MYLGRPISTVHMTIRLPLASECADLGARIGRRWTRLDRGWKSALLGLLIVGVHAAGVAI